MLQMLQIFGVLVKFKLTELHLENVKMTYHHFIAEFRQLREFIIKSVSQVWIFI